MRAFMFRSFLGLAAAHFKEQVVSLFKASFFSESLVATGHVAYPLHRCSAPTSAELCSLKGVESNHSWNTTLACKVRYG